MSVVRLDKLSAEATFSLEEKSQPRFLNDLLSRSNSTFFNQVFRLDSLTAARLYPGTIPFDPFNPKHPCEPFVLDARACQARTFRAVFAALAHL